PPSHAWQDVFGWSYYVLLTCGNLLLLVCPFLAGRIGHGRVRTFSAMLLLCAVAVWYTPLAWRNEKWLIGFYAWAAAFTVPAIVVPVGWRQVLPASLIAAFYVVVAVLH